MVRNAGRWLLIEEGSALGLFVEWKLFRDHPDELRAELRKVEISVLSSCPKVNSLFSKGLAALILAPGTYVPGLGLA
ncbi:MAG: hypothetical protein DRO39_07895 [Thermoprotei archaeon]|nr:MAG: hypothetical protein DRO39_07895 [Thermoprotei archaeon]